MDLQNVKLQTIQQTSIRQENSLYPPIVAESSQPSQPDPRTVVPPQERCSGH